MYLIDNSTAVPTRPTPAAAGTPGYFTGGNLAAGVQPTIVDNDWLNAIQQDLLAVIIAGGLTPTKGVDSQLLQAIQVLAFAGGVSTIGAARTLTANDHLTTFVATASLTLTLPNAASTFNGWRTPIRARGGNVTLATTGGATIGGQAAPYVIPRGASATVIRDDQGAFTLIFDVCPPTGIVVAASFNAQPGYIYHVDTSAGLVTGTLPAAPAPGETIRFIDTNRTFSARAFTVARNGNTIMTLAQDMTCDGTGVSGQSGVGLDFMIRWNGSDWRLV